MAESASKATGVDTLTRTNAPVLDLGTGRKDFLSYHVI